jgi:outer membrane protein OmpA-like peptidoglycan-associated protein
MNEAHGTLEQFGAALQAGDRDAVMSCFDADATVCLISGEDRITFRGTGILDAVDALLTGFANLRLKPTSRRVSKDRVVEETVVSGDHTGVFARVEATSRRVCVNVRLSATCSTESSLESLLVEADTRALFAQISGTDDVIGVTGGLIAMARERHDGALRVTDETTSSSGPASASAGTVTSRRHWMVAAGVAVALVAAALTWRTAFATGSQVPTRAANVVSTTQLKTPSTKAAPPKSGKKSQPSAGVRPVIKAANPKASPHVQAGKQVVLNSDVLFGSDSAELTPAATTAVVRLAKQLLQTKLTGTIQINGYTDNVGLVGYDSALSRSRALAVAHVLQNVLVGRNVTLVPQGFGNVNPIAPNTSEAGRARNRRVAIVLPATH